MVAGGVGGGGQLGLVAAALPAALAVAARAESATSLLMGLAWWLESLWSLVSQ